MKIIRPLVFVLCCTCSQVLAVTLTNAWINPGSGNWEDAQNWSLGSRPGFGQSIALTNHGWKAISIGANTSQNFPGSLNVASVVLGGYTDSFNLLLLNYAGFEVPLTVGSVYVGTNSGITALASALNVSTNSGAGDLSIFSTFNQGGNATVNSHMINLGNVTNSVEGFGIFNQTNGIVNADELSLAYGSTFNQFYGANSIGTLEMGAANSTSNVGEYNLTDGYLTVGSLQIFRGDFNQTGGSVNAVLELGGNYTLSAGILTLPGLSIPTVPCGLRNPCPNSIIVNATLRQTGGTNFCAGPMVVYNQSGAPGVPMPFFGPGHYVLSNGVLCVSGTVNSGSTYYDGGGDFQQWGGWHTNAGTQVIGVDMGQLGGLRFSTFTLGGGTMLTPTITVDYGGFTQSGGTNRVSSEVDVGTGDGDATFTLSGGLLADQNATVQLTGNEYFDGTHVLFLQSGGTHIVTNLLRVSGPPPSPYYPSYYSSTYVLSNGVLNALNLQVDRGANFEHDGGALTTSGLLALGYGAWNERTTGQQFGRLLLSAPAGSNANFSLPSGGCIVHFANSGSVGWSNQATLLIQNWNGSTNGGGQHQIIFASSSSSLTPQQVSQIHFLNPAGASGTFSARILSTGEIVPNGSLVVSGGGISILSGPVYNPATTHTYYLLTTSDWTDAEAAAISMGGHLVTVNDAAENDWLLSNFSNFGGQPRALWTGLNDAAQEGTFVWSSGEPVTYTHWESGQPDNGGSFYPDEDYVMIWPSPGPRSPGYWNDGRDINTFADFSFQLYGVVEVSGNNWTNPASAKWESPYWSLGKLPAADQSVNIMNSGYKAVNIDSATVTDHASSLTVGNLTVGAPTNALSTLLLNYFGQGTPLDVLGSCLIQTNGTILNLASDFEVDGTNGGTFTINGGTFTQQGGFTMVTPAINLIYGTVNATNATMNLGSVNISNSLAGASGSFYQSGGTILSAGLRIHSGTYRLLDGGTLYALDRTILDNLAAYFYQFGTNYGDVQVDGGYYSLQGGLLHGNALSSSSSGGIIQSGGAAEFATVQLDGPSGGAAYSLQSGTLRCRDLSVTGNAIFEDWWDGTVTLTNGLVLYDGRFDLFGNLFIPSMVISNNGNFTQHEGTNQVAGDITLYNTQLNFEGGRLSSVNLAVGPAGSFSQYLGTNVVSGVLSISGNYSLWGGLLSVSGMYLRGTMTITTGGNTPPPTFVNSGLINFGGTLNIYDSENSMGQLGLSTNGTIDLGPRSHVVRFADSSALNWDANARLVIADWNGSYSGGGSNQIYFGNTSAGLTPGKLSQIRFLNPGGSPSGSYPAQILSNGEVVPVSLPVLQTTRSGNQLVLTWGGNYQLLSATNVSGPYQPISGAISPYTNDIRAYRQRFFRLQAQ